MCFKSNDGGTITTFYRLRCMLGVGGERENEEICQYLVGACSEPVDIGTLPYLIHTIVL